MNQKEQELMELLVQLEAAVRRELMGRFHNSRSVVMNPHRGQGRIMSLLKLQPEISQKELGYLLDMSKQGLAELLGKLEQAGYIVRTPSLEDGRVMMIRLTEQGRKAAEEMDQKNSGSDTVFGCLTAEEQEILCGYLQRVVRYAEERTPEGFRHRHRHSRFDMNHDRRM